MTLGLLPAERAYLERRRMLPVPGKPGSGWYAVILKQRPTIAVKPLVYSDFVCELHAPTLDDARRMATEVIEDLCGQHEGHCRSGDRDTPGGPWRVALTKARETSTDGARIGPLPDGSIVYIVTRAKALERRARGHHGDTSICPRCEGPKAAAAIVCRACRERERRTPRPACPSCSRPLAGHATVCRPCRTNQSVDRALAMWQLRTDECLNNKQIAERLGVTVTAVAHTLSRLRSLGYDVPGSPWGNGSSAGYAARVEPKTLDLRNALRARGILPTKHGNAV